MSGCLKGAVKLLLLGALLLVAGAAWWFREPITRMVGGWFGQDTELPSVSDVTVGAPTQAAVQSGQEKILDLARTRGPDSVVLTPNEVASLMGQGIDWRVRRAFDSLRVELLDGKLSVHARLDTRTLPPDALGPFTGMLQEREPIRITGPISIDRPGVALWDVRELAIRGMELPPPTVKQIARRIAGVDPNGDLPVRVDRTVDSIAVRPDGVVLYRRMSR
jgi:hypothetical protein